MFLQVLHGKNLGNGWYMTMSIFNNRLLSALVLKESSFNVEQSQFHFFQRLKRMTIYEVQHLPRSAKSTFVNRFFHQKIGLAMRARSSMEE